MSWNLAWNLKDNEHVQKPLRFSDIGLGWFKFMLFEHCLYREYQTWMVFDAIIDRTWSWLCLQYNFIFLFWEVHESKTLTITINEKIWVLPNHRASTLSQHAHKKANDWWNVWSCFGWNPFYKLCSYFYCDKISNIIVIMLFVLLLVILLFHHSLYLFSLYKV